MPRWHDFTHNNHIEVVSRWHDFNYKNHIELVSH